MRDAAGIARAWGRFSARGGALHRKLGFLLAALALGTACTLITWPGIFYSDSYGRWFLAENLLRHNMAAQDDWLSVPPQLFMALLYALAGSHAAYTLAQAVLFFFTAFCAIDFFCPAGKPACGLLFAVCPVFYGFSVYVEMSVPCVTALLWLLMLVLGTDYAAAKGWGRGRRFGYLVACGFLYFVMLGFRQNAFTVLPVLLAAAALGCRGARVWWPLAAQALAAGLCFVVIAALPVVLRFGIRNGSGPMSVGFLWESVAMLGELGDNAEYAHALDFLGDEDTTENAVASNNYQSIYGYHNFIPNTVVGQGNNAARIRALYLHLALEEPAVYLKVKGEFISRALGIAAPLSAGEYDYDRDGRMAEFGFWDSPARRAFYQSYVGFQQGFPLFLRPWAVFLISGGLVAAAWRFLAGAARRRLAALWASAAFFYAAFLINTQSQEFRYFFAPLVLLYLAGAGAAAALCAGVARRMKAPRPEEYTPEEST